MEYRTIKCEWCGKFLGKVRVVDRDPEGFVHLEITLKCYNRDCLKNDVKGCNVVDIASGIKIKIAKTET